MTARRGFTLIEALVSLAILAVLATIALPSFGSHLQRQRLKLVAETLAADLAEARFEAARRGQPLHVVVQGGADWCWAVATSPNCGCDQRAACQLKTVRAADHPQIRLQDARSLALAPEGTATQGGDAATVTSERGETLRVGITAMGRGRVCTDAGAVPGYAGC